MGETKLWMSSNCSSGGPRRSTCSVHILGKHTYETFYHKVSSDSMRIWVDKIHEFQYAGKNFTVLCCKAVSAKEWASSLLTPPIENIRMTVLLIKRLNLNWYLTNSLKVGFILNMLTTGAEFYRSILIIFQNNYVEQITNPRPTNKLQ